MDEIEILCTSKDWAKNHNDRYERLKALDAPQVILDHAIRMRDWTPETERAYKIEIAAEQKRMDEWEMRNHPSTTDPDWVLKWKDLEHLPEPLRRTITWDAYVKCLPHDYCIFKRMTPLVCMGQLTWRYVAGHEEDVMFFTREEIAELRYMHEQKVNGHSCNPARESAFAYGHSTSSIYNFIEKYADWDDICITKARLSSVLEFSESYEEGPNKIEGTITGPYPLSMPHGTMNERKRSKRNN